MFNNRDRIVILVAMVVLLFAGKVEAQTTVLGFQLGKSTYKEVKANLPKGVKIKKDNGTCEYGGPSLFTEGIGYGVAGLEVVQYCFDRKQILVEVGMNLEGGRFNDIKKILASKYQPVRLKNPEAPLLFKANCDYVYLYLPRDKDIVVEYMTGSVYRQQQLAVHQTIEDYKADVRDEELRKKKALERESAKF